MRAVLLREFGPPANLEPADVPDPVAGTDEVLVEVELAGIVWVETQVRSGRSPYPQLEPQLPAVLGNGVAGTAGGRRVVTSLNGLGGYAERAVARASALHDVPDGVALTDALTAITEGRTALLALGVTEPQAGEVVLVHAAAGGVGTLLVQLAARAGARVIALASGTPVDGGTGTKLDVARALGADVALDVRDASWPEQAGPVDVVYDAAGGEVGHASFGLLRPGGRHAVLGKASGTPNGVDAEAAAARDVTLATLPFRDPVAPRAAATEALALVAAGELRPVIAPIRALEDAAGAHAAMEARTVAGKTLLRVR